MNSRSLSRLIVTIAVIIVAFWIIGTAIKIASWLLNLLLPVAAVILIVAIILSWRKAPSQKQQSTHHPKESLKISRDTSDKKR